MRSRQYTKEIGLSVEQSTVPAPVAAAICVLVVVAALLFARQVNGLKHTAEADPAPAPVKVSSR